MVLHLQHMFARLFGRKSSPIVPTYNPSLQKREKVHPHSIETVMVMDNAGFLLGSYTPDEADEKETDDALISMFISAISNFSKELFKRNDGASITVNRGEYVISLESNHRICVAFIGQYDPNLLYSKLRKLLAKIDALYKKYDEPNKIDNHIEIESIIQNFFN